MTHIQRTLLKAPPLPVPPSVPVLPPPLRLLFLILLSSTITGLSFMTTLVMAVDRTKFRTCTQTSFCRRHRHGKSQILYQYSLDPKSIVFNDKHHVVVSSITSSSDATNGYADVADSNNNPISDENYNIQRGVEQVEQQDKDNNNINNGSKAPSISKRIQKIKNMFTHNTNNNNNFSSKTIDPYVRGPEPFLTAKLVNKAKMTSTTGSAGDDTNLEVLNLAIYLLQNGIARIRITEEYKGGGGQQQQQQQESDAKKPFENARWTSDDLILEYKDMKYATDIETFMIPNQKNSNDASSSTNTTTTISTANTDEEKIKELLTQLLSTLNNDKINIDYHNYIALRYGNVYDDDSSYAKNNKNCSSSSYLLVQYQPFALHLWRNNDDKCNNETNDQLHDFLGQPIISVNSDNLLHFEIRRFKKEEQKENLVVNKVEEESEITTTTTSTNVVETNPIADVSDENNKSNDRHGGKEIVGYWEDGLAIYADGTREEKKEDTTTTADSILDSSSSIINEKRRVLMEDENSESFQIDTNGMWEEKFGDHIDSKPYGPMSVGADITFPASTSLFGLPEHASSTQLKGTTGDDAHYKEPYRLYNLDVFEYELDETMALYGEVPLIVSQSKSSGTAGVFWFNPTETFVDVEEIIESKGTKTHWMSESGIIDLFLLPGPTPKTLYRQYASLTGRMPLPPMWSLGYHQCRWNYRDEDDVFQVHEKFEELDYPYDVLWLDIEHTDGKRYFTWDQNLFPNPIAMQEKLSSQGRKMVTIIDPHIKRDNNYYIHKTATAKGYYIKDKDGKNDYDGWCWPGSSSYLDFTNEEVRNWWAEQFAYNRYIGSTPSLFTWNDMNEPSVFNGPEVSMQKDLRNLDGVEHREWHNLYGILFQRSTAEGLMQRNVDQNIRPFVLSRSFFAGSQRYGSIWTGDNESSWSHLQIAAPMLLSLNTAALSFVGADVGGFFGNPDAELMTRWMQAGAYQPFFRGHAHHDAKRREPWMFGDEWMYRMRRAAMTRYALLPYWYTVFREAGVTGMPVMRTMWMQYPDLEELYSVDDQYLIGSDLLVKPITEAGATSTVVKLPTIHDWYDVDTMLVIQTSSDKKAFESITVNSDIDKIPVYQRGGSIIARKLRLRRSTQMMINDPYTLYVALDTASKSASGVLYMDDENTFDHDKKGSYCEATFVAKWNDNRVIENKVSLVDPSWITDDMKKSRMIERIIIMGVEEVPLSMKIGAEKLTFTYDESSKVLVVRKPNVSAVSDWLITISI